MKTIHVQLNDRSCAVDDGDLAEWARTLLDDVLFDAARRVSNGGESKASVDFVIDIGEEDGSIVIAR